MTKSNVLYYVYEEGECIYTTYSEVQAKTFIEMLGNAGQYCYIVEVRK